MAKGIALTVGLNSVDPNHYQGWSGELNACEADARDMAAIAQSQGFQVQTLLTKEAKRDAVLASIKTAAGELRAGDIFLFANSSHGGQLPDLDGDEDDGKDETICLYDGQLVDDEIYLALGDFQPGVRVLAFSDSCHSGTMLKVAYMASVRAQNPAVSARSLDTEGPCRFRAMPQAIALRTYDANRGFYDKILTDPKLNGADERVRASALLISGCQDNQLSMDGTFNGLFTGTLRTVWNGGKFTRDYRAFHEQILLRMPPDQSPNFFTVGAASPEFERQRPFQIEPSKKK